MAAYPRFRVTYCFPGGPGYHLAGHPIRDLCFPLRFVCLNAINNPISAPLCVECAQRLVSARVCNNTPTTAATNWRKCSCLTSSRHHFPSPLSAGIHVSILLLWSFSSSPNSSFIFSPVFVLLCVNLSVIQTPSAINWCCSVKVFPNVQCWLPSLYLSSCEYVTQIDCVFFCFSSVLLLLLVCQWSHLVAFLCCYWTWKGQGFLA